MHLSPGRDGQAPVTAYQARSACGHPFILAAQWVIAQGPGLRTQASGIENQRSMRRTQCLTLPTPVISTEARRLSVLRSGETPVFRPAKCIVVPQPNTA